MSLDVMDVIERALRLNGALAAGDTPDAPTTADCLTAFNTMKRAWFGTLIGGRLTQQEVTGAAAQAENGGEYPVPPGAAFTLTAPLNPKSGARFGVIDVGLDFASNACTIDPNGRLIDGAAANLVLNVSGVGGRWWYRGDVGGWVAEADFAAVTDAIEFPDGLIAYMPYMLAIVIAPEFNTELRQDVIAANVEGRSALARVYAPRGRSEVDAPLGIPFPQPGAPQGPGQ